jgi:hypothetical protein
MNRRGFLKTLAIAAVAGPALLVEQRRDLTRTQREQELFGLLDRIRQTTIHSCSCGTPRGPAERDWIEWERQMEGSPPEKGGVMTCRVGYNIAREVHRRYVAWHDSEIAVG